MSLSSDQITQIAFMTRDIRRSIEHFTTDLRVGPWFVMEGGSFTQCRYRGVDCAPRLTTAFANARGFEFELMQLDNDVPCMWRDALAAPFAREAFHHWCVWPDDYDAKLAEMLDAGLRIYQDGSTPRGRFVYLQHPDRPDIVEITERTPERRAFQERVAAAGRAWDGTQPIATDNT